MFYFFCVRYPYVTGTSIVAIKYKDGVLMASDMGGMFPFLIVAYHCLFASLLLVSLFS